MRRFRNLIGLSVAVLCSAQTLEVSGARIRAHVKFLSSDLMEGRGVGSRGGDLATEYIATQFALAGAQPAGDNGTYYQRVPLSGVTTMPDATLTAVRKGQEEPLRFMEDWVGTPETQRPVEDFDAEAVFVGHGITAPEFRWDDYKNANVKGKVLIYFTNEPASNDPKFFGGRALTYYGRWTYKFEEATRRGAVGAVIIHTTPTAGYGWDVVRNSWGREDFQVEREPGAAALSLAAWVNQEAGERLLKGSGHSVDELLRASESRDFRPIPLGFHLRAHVPVKVRPIESRNVVAMVPGSDPKLKSEFVVFSAHWDHLGIGTPVNGDAIYNGAIDNATGCGVLLELAAAWAAQAQKPRRSALFISVTAEEGGLLGSEYYGRHPIVPPGKIAIDLNYDALEPFGRTLDVVMSGSERSTAYPVVEEAAKRFRLQLQPDPRPEQGSYYRSDHFSFARVGVPGFTIKTGTRFAGKPETYGAESFREYNTKHYHQPSDEFQESWDFSGVEELTRLGMRIGIDIANQNALPTWNKGDEFLAAREKSWK